MGRFSLILISILLEALPFVLIGSFISGFIHLYVTEKHITKVLPKNKYLQIFIASILGLIFPVCECAIIPIVRRLFEKKLPLSVGIAFMLNVPIVNPVVMLSTYYAFDGDLKFVMLRSLGGITAACIIAIIMDRIYKGAPLKSMPVDMEIEPEISKEFTHEQRGTSGALNVASVDIVLDMKKSKGIRWKNTFKNLAMHTTEEFMSVGKYLIFGAILSATMQVYFPREILVSMGKTPLAPLMMMLLAFILSLCSEADAFIARTFYLQFSNASIISFLIFGPMIDIKNTVMLTGVMKKEFTVKLILTITTACLAIGMLLQVVGI